MKDDKKELKSQLKDLERYRNNYLKLIRLIPKDSTVRIQLKAINLQIKQKRTEINKYGFLQNVWDQINSKIEKESYFI